MLFHGHSLKEHRLSKIHVEGTVVELDNGAFYMDLGQAMLLQ